MPSRGFTHLDSSRERLNHVAIDRCSTNSLDLLGDGAYRRVNAPVVPLIAGTGPLSTVACRHFRARADAIRIAPPGVCSGGSGGGRTRRLEPAFRWRVDPPGDGGRNPRNAPACKENVMRGRGVSKSCCTNSKDDSSHEKAGNGICPVVPVLLHVVLPTLPADTARLRRVAHTPGPGGSSQENSCHSAAINVHPLVIPT
jgi:hypothetical protein